MKPAAGSAGVVSTLTMLMRPVSSSTKAASVKVPPMSTPMRHGIMDTMPSIARRGASGSRRRHVGPARVGAIRINRRRAWIHDDAVDLPRAPGRHLAEAHVLGHTLRRALVGGASAPASRRLHADHVAG